MWGGDVLAGKNYNYLQISEAAIGDQGFDTAAIADVRTLNRTNATGALGCVWLGSFLNSAGSQPIDAAYVLKGKAKTGIDFTTANFGTGQAAINLANNQRIYWGSTGSIDPLGLSFYGNILSGTFMFADNSASPKSFNINQDGINTLVCQPNAVFSSGLFSAATSVAAGTTVTAGSSVAATTFVTAGTYVNATSAYKVAGVQVLAPRITGWALPTATLSRATFDPTTVTLPELAKRVAALINDSMFHGFIGV
jgi:hypothetical protein